MKALVVIAVALCACTADPPPPPEPPEVPIALQVCQAAYMPPKPPPTPRTIKQFTDWTVEVYMALLKTAAARDDCARRLDSLNEWIAEQQGRRPTAK